MGRFQQRIWNTFLTKLTIPFGCFYYSFFSNTLHKNKNVKKGKQLHGSRSVYRKCMFIKFFIFIIIFFVIWFQCFWVYFPIRCIRLNTLKKTTYWFLVLHLSRIVTEVLKPDVNIFDCWKVTLKYLSWLFYSLMK